MPEKIVQDTLLELQKDGKDYYHQVVVDSDGVFWILIEEIGIYRFDPTTGNMKRFFNTLGSFQDAKIAPDGTLYTLIYSETIQDGKIKKVSSLNYFIPKTKETSSYSLNYLLEPYPTPGLDIFIDHRGRVWLDNVAYLDEAKAWYQLNRSPLFVSPVREVYSDYQYKSANIVLESSDGRLWFLHPQNGMISLDPQKGEWCWFTTYQSNIVEDSDHNLWMIADGKLYKHPLKTNP